VKKLKSTCGKTFHYKFENPLYISTFFGEKRARKMASTIKKCYIFGNSEQKYTWKTTLQSY
jgi:hypothetical protein